MSVHKQLILSGKWSGGGSARKEKCRAGRRQKYRKTWNLEASSAACCLFRSARTSYSTVESLPSTFQITSSALYIIPGSCQTTHMTRGGGGGGGKVYNRKFPTCAGCDLNFVGEVALFTFVTLQEWDRKKLLSFKDWIHLTKINLCSFSAKPTTLSCWVYKIQPVQHLNDNSGKKKREGGLCRDFHLWWWLLMDGKVLSKQLYNTSRHLIWQVSDCVCRPFCN